MAKAFLGTNQRVTQVSQIPTTQVFEFAAFEQVPHQFLGIDMKSVQRVDTKWCIHQVVIK